MAEEFEKGNSDFPIISSLVRAAVSILPGENPTGNYTKCIITDDETGEVLAEGFGDTEAEAKEDAEAKL